MKGKSRKSPLDCAFLLSFFCSFYSVFSGQAKVEGTARATEPKGQWTEADCVYPHGLERLRASNGKTEKKSRHPHGGRQSLTTKVQIGKKQVWRPAICE